MVRILLIIVVLSVLLMIGCLTAKRDFCAKQYMNNHKFVYLSSDDRLTDKYFLIKDTVQLEYSGDSLYSESRVNWRSCNEYNLIINKVYYEEGLRPGDTLFIRLQSFKKDTVLCSATAYKHTFFIKFLKKG